MFSPFSSRIFISAHTYACDIDERSIGVGNDSDDVDRTGRGVFHVNHWMAVLRGRAYRQAWTVLRPIHGRSYLQLCPPGLYVVTFSLDNRIQNTRTFLPRHLPPLTCPPHISPPGEFPLSFYISPLPPPQCADLYKAIYRN